MVVSLMYMRMIIRVKFGDAISALTRPAEIEHMDLIVLGCETSLIPCGKLT